MTSLVRPLLRTVGSVILLAPLLWTGANLIADLRTRPTGRTPVTAASGNADVPLRAGATLLVPLATSRELIRGLVIRAAPPTTSPRRLRCRVCVDSRCVTSEGDLDSEGAIALAVPEGTRGGTLSLSILRMDGPDAVLRERIGYPALEVVRGYSWSPSLGRARELARAMAGIDLFPAALLVYGVGLFAALALALARATSPPDAPPAVQGKQDRQTDVPLPSSSQ